MQLNEKNRIRRPEVPFAVRCFPNAAVRCEVHEDGGGLVREPELNTGWVVESGTVPRPERFEWTLPLMTTFSVL